MPPKVQAIEFRATSWVRIGLKKQHDQLGNRDTPGVGHQCDSGMRNLGYKVARPKRTKREVHTVLWIVPDTRISTLPSIEN